LGELYYKGEFAITVPENARRQEPRERVAPKGSYGSVISETQHILLYGINSFLIEIDRF
jgi:hypothetical protein